MRRGKTVAIGAVVVLLGAAVAVVATGAVDTPLTDDDGSTSTGTSADGSTDDGEVEDSAEALDLVGIERGDLTSTSEFTGELGFGEVWPVPLTAEGIVTGARPVGTVVEFGQSLLEIDALLVFLVEGDVPMFRDMELTSPRMIGGDVAQLQRYLISQGFDDDGALVADGEFDSATRRAVLDWQEATLQPETGRVTRAEMVFSPAPVRIASELRLGEVFEGLELTAWEPTVTVEVANSDKQLLEVGTPVTIEFGDGTAVDGTVSEQVSVPQEDGTTLARSTIEPDGDVPGETGSVTIGVDTTLASDVTLVPVGALLALAEGGYAVEVAGDAGNEMVAVEVGEILDGMAEVTGDIAVGDLVLVAK
jgi:peptidoglycan hydrolase-like protein with peptidoglycan-binding domain